MLGAGGGFVTGQTITVDGYQPAPDERVSAAYNFVGPDYFRTLQTPVLRGRDFLLSDDERALLGAFRYSRNLTVLHSDASLMPRRRRAWAVASPPSGSENRPISATEVPSLSFSS